MPPKKEAPAPAPAPEPSVVETSEATIMNGKFVFVDDSIYEGEYIEVNSKKMRNGKGIFTSSGAFDKYNGNWKNDMMNGEGEYIFSSGAIYKGTFKDNLFDGEGEYIFADGSKYNGEWKANKMHGNGEYIDIDNVSWKGNFFNGLFNSGKTLITINPRQMF